MSKKEYEEMISLIRMFKDGHDVLSRCKIEIAMTKSPRDRIAYCGAALESTCKAQVLEEVLEMMDEVHKKYNGGQNETK